MATRTPMRDYERALKTMSAVVEELRGLPDPDGALADLADWIEAEREWVNTLVALGAKPGRPPAWLRGMPAHSGLGSWLGS